MTIEELEEKRDNAAKKVEKCKDTIVRHKKQEEKKRLELEKKGIDVNNVDRKEYRTADKQEIYWLICDYENKKDDIQRANEKLLDAERILENWNNKLNAAMEKDEFIQRSAPGVILDFLEKWKNEAYEWNLRHYEDYQQFKEKLSDEVVAAKIECLKVTPEYDYAYKKYMESKSVHYLDNPYPRIYMDKYLKERNLDYRGISTAKRNYAGQIVLTMDSIHDEKERIAWLQKSLEKEKKAKLVDLINRIHDVVGTITDASQLCIGAKGEIDGIISGTEGKAKIECIGAGGYNIQCYHFRVLIHKYNEDKVQENTRMFVKRKSI